MARKKNKHANVSSEWLRDDVIEVPHPTSDDTKRLEKRKRFFRTWVWSSIFLLPLALLAIAGLVGQLITAEEEVESAVESPRKGTAIVEVEKWLGTNPQPLPGGKVLSWDSVENVPVPEPKNGEEDPDPPIMEIHHLTVGNRSGMTFNVAVELSTTKAYGTQLVSGPSMIPQPPRSEADSTGDINPWPSLEEADVNDSVNAAVEQWAKAFTSGNPDELRLAVGDERPDVSYMPLTGVRLDGASVQRAGVRTTTGGDEELPDTIVVAANLTIVWKGHEPKDGETTSSNVTYDLLVERASTASPRVVAWAAPGQGAYIERHSNALEGRNLTTDGVAESTDSDETTSGSDTTSEPTDSASTESDPASEEEPPTEN